MQVQISQHENQMHLKIEPLEEQEEQQAADPTPNEVVFEVFYPCSYGENPPLFASPFTQKEITEISHRRRSRPKNHTQSNMNKAKIVKSFRKKFKIKTSSRANQFTSISSYFPHKDRTDLGSETEKL